MKKHIFLRLVCGLGFIVLVLGFSRCAHRGFVKATLPTIEGASYVGSETCADCHEELYAKFKTSIHGRLASFEAVGIKKGCEACHGPGSLHSEEGDPEKILKFGKLNYAEKSEICLQCHTQSYWRTSEHALNGNACSDCHKIHNPKEKKLLVKTEPSLCYECHQDIRMKTLYPSHHPIWESERTGRKRMTCGDCHDVHGSPIKSLKTEERINDLCFKCHAGYQGPFIYEHEPVVEDCTICHEPHGTVANNLLKQNEPFICLQCHEFHFHAGKESGVGELSVPAHKDILTGNSGETPYTGPFPAQGFKMAFTTKCTQCHSQVHGSDLPSLSVPGQGRALTR